MKRLIAPLAVLLLCAPALAEDAAQPAPEFTDEQLEFFEKKIRPVLADKCYSCHSHSAKKNKGGFYLDSRAGILKDFLAEPGEPDESLIIEAVHYKTPGMQMPPKGKLPDAVIKDLEKWVEMGMPWPEEKAPGSGEQFDLEARKAAHWAWKAPKRAKPLPTVPGLGAGANVIDRYIESRLIKEGIRPAPAADKATLIRRVTVDLTGLPPTAQEVMAFVNDKSPDAYEKLVDRLLASPRYGEKWGRHWLDLVRYAESFGHEFDINIPHAWKYRDYVIRAINDDVPYDRYVKEHLAGDLIEPRIHPETKVNEAVKATGWWFMHEQTHAPTDVRLHEVERIDNQIDVLSKTFQGVTVACARCHDHKFDAISAADYYAVAGYMQSSRLQQAYLDPGGKIGEQARLLTTLKASGQKKFQRLKAKPVPPTTIQHKDSILFEDFNGGSFNGWLATGWAWGDAPTAQNQWDARSGKASPILPGTIHSGLLGDHAVGTIRSPEFDLKHKQVWIRVKGKGNARLIMDSYTVHLLKDLLFEGFRTKIDTKGKWQWVLLQDRRNLYAGKDNHRAHIELIDDLTNGYMVIDEVRFSDGARPPEPKSSAAIASADPKLDAQFAQITKQITQAAAKLPKPERVLAITDGSGENSYVHLRGSYKGKGQAVQRRLLTALGGEVMAKPKRGSGRDLFAEKIVDPSNPLTARVQVNRLWHHLFGVGIVPTVDNFGVLGIAPSHPELLDQLALDFIEKDKWSNKAMIKRIVMSRAYRRSSDKMDSVAEEKDPTNTLLHRQRIRRMTAESIRDSILAVSGSLNEKQFGPPVSVYLTQFMQGRGRPKSGPIDGQGRRSIYISVRRNFLSPMMLAFDAPIPFSTVGRRNVTNVPAQALTLMNDPFVHDQADKWSKRLVKDGSKSVASRVNAMFLAVLGRTPTDKERAAAQAYLSQRFSGYGVKDAATLTDPRAWRDLCHVMLNLKGFIYLR